MFSPRSLRSSSWNRSLFALVLVPLLACRHDSAPVEQSAPPAAPGPSAIEPVAVPDSTPAEVSTPDEAPDASPIPTAPVEPAPVEPAPVEPAPVAPAPASLLAIADANVTVGAAQVDGLRVAQLACAVDRAPLMGTLLILGSLAKHDAAFDRCAPKGDAAILEWRFVDGRAQDVTVRGASTAKIDACLAAALRKVKGPFDARCGAVLQIGKPAGADAALDRLVATPR